MKKYYEQLYANKCNNLDEKVKIIQTGREHGLIDLTRTMAKVKDRTKSVLLHFALGVQMCFPSLKCQSNIHQLKKNQQRLTKNGHEVTPMLSPSEQRSGQRGVWPLD